MVKLQIFLILVCLLFGNHYYTDELTSATLKETMTLNIIFVGAIPINKWKVHMPVSFVFAYVHPITQRYR